MKEKLRLAIVGLGERGRSFYGQAVAPSEDVEVVAVCDNRPQRCDLLAGEMAKLHKPPPALYTDYRALFDAETLDAALISTSWEERVPATVAAMEAGVYVGCEAGGAYSVEDCWRLVRAHERTGTRVMLLENCCFGRLELMALNMRRQGFFGTVCHCGGAYRHDLREEIAFGWKNGHYRLDNYLRRNCDNYPTHELGPIAMLLGLNRGNRMVSLVSMASKAAGMEEYVASGRAPDERLRGRRFAQGDLVTTLIKCAGGETISLTLDTTLPRFYSRSLSVHGTCALLCEDGRTVYEDTEACRAAEWEWERTGYNNLDAYYEKFDHPLWKRFLAEGVRGGHGGMDYLLLRDFVAGARAGRPPSIDVYDMAAWMAVTALSETSIALGSAPVEVPDFTGGKWLTRGDDFLL